jgi:hypothetical protein
MTKLFKLKLIITLLFISNTTLASKDNNWITSYESSFFYKGVETQISFNTDGSLKEIKLPDEFSNSGWGCVSKLSSDDNYVFFKIMCVNVNINKNITLATTAACLSNRFDEGWGNVTLFNSKNMTMLVKCTTEQKHPI